MNIKLLLILLAAIGGMSYGVLSNEMELSVQQFDFVALPAMDEDPLADHDSLGSFKCSCLGTDENGEEIFDPGFCNVDYNVEPTDDDPGVAADGSLGLSGNKLCLWEAHEGDYGELISASDEGCSSKFWLDHSDYASSDYVWPPGYHPDYEYASMFHQVFVVETGKNEIIKFSGEHTVYIDNLNELLDKSKKDKKTASTIKKLLKTVPSAEDEGYWMISGKTLEKFNKNLLKLIEKEKLSDEDKNFLLEILNGFRKGSYKDNNFTLLEALNQENYLKQKQKKLAMESVASILNAAHSKVDYHYSVPEVMSMVHDAMLSEDYNLYSKEFKKHNVVGESSLCSSHNHSHDDSKKNDDSHDDSKKNDDSHDDSKKNDDSHDDSRDD